MACYRDSFTLWWGSEFRDLKAYCERVNIPFKIHLLDFPPHISDTSENSNVMFLPPNITSLIQPLD
jgi:hypothetical protein